jgi:hypothetical protein
VIRALPKLGKEVLHIPVGCHRVAYALK